MHDDSKRLDAAQPVADACFGGIIWRPGVEIPENPTPLYAAPQASAEYERGHADGWAAAWDQAIKQPQADKDGGQQPKRYVVLKASGSRYAYVNDTQEGRSINRFDVLKGDGWRYAHEFADRMNNEHARAALSATQPEQGERDA